MEPILEARIRKIDFGKSPNEAGSEEVEVITKTKN